MFYVNSFIVLVRVSLLDVILTNVMVPCLELSCQFGYSQNILRALYDKYFTLGCLITIEFLTFLIIFCR
jgi:hypothetical protein